VSECRCLVSLRYRVRRGRTLALVQDGQTHCATRIDVCVKETLGKSTFGGSRRVGCVKLHGERKHPALPGGTLFAGDTADPLHQVRSALLVGLRPSEEALQSRRREGERTQRWERRRVVSLLDALSRSLSPSLADDVHGASSSETVYAPAEDDQVQGKTW